MARTQAQTRSISDGMALARALRNEYFLSSRHSAICGAACSRGDSCSASVANAYTAGFCQTRRRAVIDRSARIFCMCDFPNNTIGYRRDHGDASKARRTRGAFCGIFLPTSQKLLLIVVGSRIYVATGVPSQPHSPHGPDPNKDLTPVFAEGRTR